MQKISLEPRQLATKLKGELEKISADPSHTKEVIRNKLLELSKCIPQDNELWSPFLQSVTLTNVAFNHVFKDAQCISWASWPERALWLQAELEAVESQMGGSQSPRVSIAGRDPQTSLEALRSFFASDDGWPASALLDQFSAVTKLVTHRALVRKGLYSLATASANNSNHHTIERCAVSISSDLALQQELFAVVRQSRSDSNNELVGKVATLLVTKDPSLQYEALKQFESKTATQIFGDIRVVLFDKDSGISPSLQQSISAFNWIWKERSSNYFTVEPEELSNTLQRDGTTLMAIYWRAELRVVAQLMPQAAFYERTNQKLGQIGSAYLESAGNVLGWKYYVLTNPDKPKDSDGSRVDWLRLSDEVIQDLAVSEGMELVLGIFDSASPSKPRHEGIGWKPVAPIRFFSDSGSAAEIMGKSLFDVE